MAPAGALDRLERSMRAIQAVHPKSRWPEPEAAVAALIWDVKRAPSLVLMRRSMLVHHYKGHIAFPGGSREREDSSLRDTAIRETVEELGVRSEDIELWGDLDSVTTSDGMTVRPFTGRLNPAAILDPDPGEVGSILTVAVQDLIRIDSERDETRLIDGKLISRPAYSYNGNVVWGATARILAQLIPIARSAWEEAGRPIE
ncbi:MAG: CoA pyrophosphatase [SAR202 cluster bacterium]|nr:CoA pyrophosphatase [SAR202 cluster bacterium]